ncbi:MAG: hypothetical protein JNN25_07970 [Candidatus Kapabacteria bacterium]|nr:hypothetical protein [Candidatus Kapabacteria bacterium]
MKTNINSTSVDASSAPAQTLRHTLSAAVLVLTGLVLIATSLLAQPPVPPPGKGPRIVPEKMAERRTNHLKKALKLTDEQVSKIQPIILNGAQQGRKIAEEKKGDRKAAAEAMKTAMEATDKEISAVLTADQQKKFEEMRGKMKAKMEARMSHRKERKADK